MNHDLERLTEFRNKIESNEVKEAFYYLVGEAISNDKWTCLTYKSKDSFRYFEDKDMRGEYPFSFIVNQGKGLLFYVRDKNYFKSFDGKFEYDKDEPGQKTIRIWNLEDAKKVVACMYS